MVVLLFGFLSTFADAALLKRGKRMVYDTCLNITILDFSYNSQGFIDAHLWAKDLVVYFNYHRIADWRLPKLITACTGYACKQSELGHLWYVELKNQRLYRWDGTINPNGGLQDVGPFVNLYPEAYWLGPRNQSLLDRSYSWGFDMDSGAQSKIDFEYQASYGIAVRDGDISLVMTDTRDDAEDEAAMGDEERFE